MKLGFARYNLTYEHKINQYDSTKIPQGSRVVSNEDVGQAYLAIALKKPGDGRRRKYKVWEDHYGEIFSGGSVEPHVICLLIFETATRWAKSARRRENASDLRRKLINNGIFHIARIASHLWRGSDSFKQSAAVLQEQITTLIATPSLIDPYFDDALNKLESLVLGSNAFINDVDGALKASLLETTITNSLHTPPTEKRQVQATLAL